MWASDIRRGRCIHIHSIGKNSQPSWIIHFAKHRFLSGCQSDIRYRTVPTDSNENRSRLASRCGSAVPVWLQSRCQDKYRQRRASCCARCSECRKSNDNVRQADDLRWRRSQDVLGVPQLLTICGRFRFQHVWRTRKSLQLGQYLEPLQRIRIGLFKCVQSVCGGPAGNCRQLWHLLWSSNPELISCRDRSRWKVLRLAS